VKFCSTFHLGTIYLRDVAGFGAGNCAGVFTVAGFSGANGFTKASLKS
jgi:hypothetical protein